MRHAETLKQVAALMNTVSSPQLVCNSLWLNSFPDGVADRALVFDLPEFVFRTHSFRYVKGG